MNIKSGLSEFQFTREVYAISDHTISALIGVYTGRSFEYIEAMAQLAALHVRYLLKLQKHSFLLSVSDMELSGDTERGSRLCKATADLTEQGSSSFKYSCTVYAESATIKGSVLIASREYDDTFDRESIQQQYKRIFSCLQIELNEH